ncbi:MAG: amino acid decarboxylase [Clostridia bacterium]|nr:amino acid decarboxylase [Clostridia bacterium]
MNTPIADFVRAYAEKNPARFHMPAHKGRAILGCEALDITEIDGADDLSASHGIIAESEKNAASLFGVGHTFYSCEGSTLAIKAMLALAVQGAKKGTVPTVLAARNAHRAFVFAAALLDIHVAWLYPKASAHLCECPITPTDLESALRTSEAPVAACYVTSPDYLGNRLDIAGLSAVCKRYGVPLLVDNAHGAYLAFLSPSEHPIALGATMCCDSAHKTLPALTGGAYLHISADAPAIYAQNARSLLSVFSSTSPSYLILQSLDLCNAILSSDYPKALAHTIEKLTAVKQKLRENGWTLPDGEPLKLTLPTRAYGYSGHELASYLSEHHIFIEFHDDAYAVLMLSPANTDAEIEHLCSVLCALPKKTPLASLSHPIPAPASPAMTMRKALLASKERIPTQAAIGRICAIPTLSCPPAIPIVLCGERITGETAALLSLYGMDAVDVVTEDEEPAK